MHKVLVVDDDKVLQQSVKQALEYHHVRCGGSRQW